MSTGQVGILRSQHADHLSCVCPQCEVLSGLACPDSDNQAKRADLLVTSLGVEPFGESVNVNVCRIDDRPGHEVLPHGDFARITTPSLAGPGGAVNRRGRLGPGEGGLNLLIHGPLIRAL